MEIEKLICTHTQDEGIGSVYERIMLKRYFERIIRTYSFRSVLEYGCEITKGYDNLVFVRDGEVTVADKNIAQIEKGWKFEERPQFSGIEIDGKYDLVWNFAVVQILPEVIDRMKQLSQKYILVFVPNALNWGTPFHLAYHLFTRTVCQHAERGSWTLRTRIGLRRFAKRKGIRVLDCDYIDTPPIPDIAFSIRELKQALGMEVNSKDVSAKYPEAVLQRVEDMMLIEKRRWPSIIKAIFAHHIYLLGEVSA